MSARRKRKDTMETVPNDSDAARQQVQVQGKPADGFPVATAASAVEGYETVRRLVTDNGAFYGIPDADDPTVYRCLREVEWDAFQRILDDLSTFVPVSRDLAFRCRVTEFGGVTLVRYAGGED
jgi:hypothetical protein